MLNQSHGEMQMLGDDRAVHLLRETAGRAVPRGDVAERSGRPTTASRAAIGTVRSRASPPPTSGRLVPQWVFTLPNAAQLQVTPVVADGVMYVTAANDFYALDAGSGRQIWNYRRPRTRGLAGVAARGVNRGVAVGGDRVFVTTDHAHLIALNRATGALLWETEMADWHQNYNGTGAPLVVDNLVISGHRGRRRRRSRLRGRVRSGDRQRGVAVLGGAGSRGAGSRDVEGNGDRSPWRRHLDDRQLRPASSGTLYWAIGNPGPDMIGDERQGDNLYSDSVVALDVKTGRRKWHFQFTPHDVHDYDAQQPLVLVDAIWKGRPRKLLVQANRNGYFYVLDRTTGEYLLGTQYVKNVTWASGLTPDGRPIVVPNMEPTPEGRRVCPSLEGASNWYSASFSPRTGLFYVQTNDKCGIFTRVDQPWEPGQELHGRHVCGRARARAARAAGHRHPDGQGRLGAAAVRRRGLVGRRAEHGRRRGVLLRRQRRVRGGGRALRQAAVELPDQPGVEVVADDLPVRQPSVRGGGVRPEHPRVRAAGRCPVNPGRGSLDEVEPHAVTGIPERQTLGRRLRRIRTRHDIAHVVAV